MSTLVQIIFHMDEWLHQMVAFYPMLTYLLFFAIIFTESAFFPLAPFLPGDGLLFGVGVIAASQSINVWLAMAMMIAGGVLGNYVAYQLGQHFGPVLFDRFSWLNREHYLKANLFYQKHGSKAFIFSRYLPVVRALVPFVVGVAKMPRADFNKISSV